LQDARWPERHDCALLTSKGFATRVARDVLDLLGEPLRFFCVHHADGPGTKIYEALQQATEARPGRQVAIVNLGLEPDEAIRMGLAVEDVLRKDRRAVPVAGYVTGKWRHWLQSQRVELNSMTTPQFLAWLDGKITSYEKGKLMPPSSVMTQRLRQEARERSFEQTRARILREQRFEKQAARDYCRLQPSLRQAAQRLRHHVIRFLKDQPAAWWPQAVTQTATNLVRTDDPGIGEGTGSGIVPRRKAAAGKTRSR
jgi:hypothetical protein